MITISKILKSGIYIPVFAKFIIAQLFAILWVSFSIYVSYPWFYDLSTIVGNVAAILMITFIAYIPGYLVSFTAVSLLLDKQPPLKVSNPNVPVTILIAARNEEDKIVETLKYISKQDYSGEIKIILVDNNSTDNTVEVARKAAEKLNFDLKIISESKPGKSHALNKGLSFVETELFATLDADTLLHPKAIRYIVARILSAPSNVCAVAGHVLARNSRDNIITRMQEWDYFIGIASIKRMQGLYQGTLVAQGAFSLYKRDVVRSVGGWPDMIGEDIVLTWKFFEAGYKVYFEPMAVAFTEVPEKLSNFQRQRSRWARGMIEGLKTTGPWKHHKWYSIYLTSIDLIIPFVDLAYTLVWIPGLILAFLGKYYIVGMYTLFVLPLNLLVIFIMGGFQKEVFEILNLRIRRNRIGFIIYFLFYQIIHSPISVWGYLQEIFGFQRKWK